jgi:UPF0271 protein
MRVDLNCDLGESFGPYTLGNDEAVMSSITSANIACGVHAGDPSVSRRTVRLALARGVAVGAHPGFDDRQGFGRRALDVSSAEVEDLVLYQVSALSGIVEAEGGVLQHVKPHGALYNMAARDDELAAAVARAVMSVSRHLILFGLSGSSLMSAGQAEGLRVASEAFADRAYDARGALVPRTRPHAVIHDGPSLVARAVQMARHGTVTAISGERVHLQVDTICVHGDTPGAAELATGLRRGLEESEISVMPVGEP